MAHLSRSDKLRSCTAVATATRSFFAARSPSDSGRGAADEFFDSLGRSPNVTRATVARRLHIASYRMLRWLDNHYVYGQRGFRSWPPSATLKKREPVDRDGNATDSRSPALTRHAPAMYRSRPAALTVTPNV
jgi:hypothetical protein